MQPRRPAPAFLLGSLRLFRQQRSRWGVFLQIPAWRELVAGLGFFLVGAISLFASTGPATRTTTDVPSPGESLDSQYPHLGDWIWAAETHDQQICRFWKRIDIPKNTSVVRAELIITADDAYRLFVDGREIGEGAHWTHFTDYNLAQILGPGPHILAIEGFNEYLIAGVVCGLHIQMQDGQSMDVTTDGSWRVVPNNEKNWTTKWKANPDWKPAVVKARFSDGKWNVKIGHNIFYVSPILPVVVTFWQSGWFRILILSVCAVLSVFCVWLVGRLAVYAQAQQVIRRERARIARDIHDDLTAGLTQLVLFGEVFQNELAKGSEARRQAAKVCEKARGLSQAMNEIIWMVNSQRDTFRDFSSYVCKYAETFFSSTPIRCRFDVEDDMPDLPCDLGVRRNLFLGVKEALNNALRHSGADELLLRIHRLGGQMVVSVEDNGKGFDPDLALAGGQGNGLSNMTARAAEAGGDCRIVSQPGTGCRVEFVVSLAREKRAHWKFWGNRSNNLAQVLPVHPTKDL